MNAGCSAFSISTSPTLARVESSVPSRTNPSSNGFQSTSLRNFFCSLSNVRVNSDLILSVM